MHKTEIGIRLAELRKYIGISRNSLAKMSDIPAITIKSWEHGISEIRAGNLEKYLKILAKLGCYTTKEWVLHGTGPNPNIEDKNNERLAQDSVNIAHIIELLSKTSNLFYYLDNNENIIHINRNLLFLLGGDIDYYTEITEQTRLQELCSPEIYNICRENFILCQEREERRFSYNIKKQYSTTFHVVDVLYWPLTKHGSDQILGVLCFVSNTQTKEIT